MLSWTSFLDQGYTNFPNIYNWPHILCARRVTYSMFHTQNPSTIDTTVENLVTQDLCNPVLDNTEQWLFSPAFFHLHQNNPVQCHKHLFTTHSSNFILWYSLYLYISQIIQSCCIIEMAGIQNKHHTNTNKQPFILSQLARSYSYVSRLHYEHMGNACGFKNVRSLIRDDHFRQ